MLNQIKVNYPWNINTYHHDRFSLFIFLQSSNYNNKDACIADMNKLDVHCDDDEPCRIFHIYTGDHNQNDDENKHDYNVCHGDQYIGSCNFVTDIWNVFVMKILPCSKEDRLNKRFVIRICLILAPVTRKLLKWLRKMNPVSRVSTSCEHVQSVISYYLDHAVLNLARRTYEDCFFYI